MKVCELLNEKTHTSSSVVHDAIMQVYNELSKNGTQTVSSKDLRRILSQPPYNLHVTTIHSAIKRLGLPVTKVIDTNTVDKLTKQVFDTLSQNGKQKVELKELRRILMRPPYNLSGNTVYQAVERLQLPTFKARTDIEVNNMVITVYNKLNMKGQVHAKELRRVLRFPPYALSDSTTNRAIKRLDLSVI